MNFKLLLVYTILLFVLSCDDNQDKTYKLLEKSEMDTNEEAAVGEVNSKMNIVDNPFSLADFTHKNTNLEIVTDSIFSKLSIDEKVAQMIMPAIDMDDKEFGFENIKTLFAAKIIGGVLFLRGKTPEFISHFQSLTQLAEKNKQLRPLISCDGESALIHYKFKDIEKFLPASELKTADEVSNSSLKIVTLLAKMGININFAPVADNNTNKSIIRNRSFGSSSAEIIEKCHSFIKAHQENNMVSVLKHFPGHGNVTGDSHKGLVYIDGELTEVSTFAKIIGQSDPAGIMIGHIAIKRNDRWNTQDMPSSISRLIVTKLLRDSLRYNGIIYTDAMNMGALKNIKDASFKAACAGVDIVLMPVNPEKLHARIKNEIEKNTLYRKQFENSIKRIIRLKICLKLI